jgi:ribosomal-protein-alanine N-acetyltransferase
MRHDDADAYYQRIYSDPEAMRTLPSRAVISRELFDERIPDFMNDHWEEHGFGAWIVASREDDRLLGHCGLKYWPGTENVEVFYALERRAWGRGLASEAAHAAVAAGFRDLQLECVVAGVLPENLASQRVLEKLGMRRSGSLVLGDLTVLGYRVDRADFR